MTSPLPVRPTPAAGEALTGYAARLAEANGMSPRRILPSHRHDVGIPQEELATVATLAGLEEATARQLTMDRYPPTVRGRGRTHRGGWRLHSSVEWACLRCTPLTGHRELLWQTALSPVCRHCHLLLVPAKEQTCEPVAADDRQQRLVEELAALAELSIAHQSARLKLGAFRRLCAHIAQTIDETWPARPADLHPLNIDAARTWGAFPSPDPATVMVILTAAYPALHSRYTRERLVREGHRRRRSRTLAQLPRHVPSAGRYLPKRAPAPRPPAILAGFNAADARRLDWLTARLTHHVRRHGIQPDHVPALLPAHGDDGLPDPAQWRTRWHAAIALHMLLTAAHDGPTSSARACHAFGTTDTDTSLLLDGLRLGRGVHEPDAGLITDAVETLISVGLVDYQRRRDTLRAVTRLSRLDVAGRRLPEIQGHPGHVLALAWIWTRLTHGPTFTSPRPFIADRHVRAFDASIDPETRLVLAEMGQQLLADVDLTTIPATHTTWTGVTRRYG